MTGVSNRRLAGRVSIITGAGRGLGRGYAHRLTAEGSKILVADINAESSKRVAEEIEPRDAALAATVDVTDESSVAEMVGAAVETWGRVDVLVNNAAMFANIEMKPFEEIAVEEWDAIMAVNLRGMFLCCREVAPVMRRQQYGRIINVSSGTTLIGRRNYLHYVTSKAGVVGLSRALATELGPDGIAVNTIMPGYTQTEVPRGTVTAAQAERIVAGQAMPHQLQTQDMVGTVAFLASDDAAYITGQTINVDAGTAYL